MEIITVNSSSPHPFHTQNKTTTQQTKKTNPAKNNIKNKTIDHNKDKPLTFKNPILQIHNSNK